MFRSARVSTFEYRAGAGPDAAVSTNRDYEALAAGDAAAPASSRPGDASNAPDDAGAEMYYTSGTSGRPKGVVLSKRNVVLHALGCVVEHGLHAGDVWLHCAPMFHLVDASGEPRGRL